MQLIKIRRIGNAIYVQKSHTECEHEYGDTHTKHKEGHPLKKAKLCHNCGHLHWPGEVIKAMALKTGQHWITVHPNGNEEHGVPILIQDHPDGTASVVGGAGGKLNYLKLTKLKPKEDWRRASVEKQKAKAEEEKNRKAGMTKQEREIEADATSAVTNKRDFKMTEFVQTVMEAHGVDDWKLSPKVLKDMPKKSRDLAEKQHLNKMVKEAKKLVEESRADILAAQDDVIQQITADIPLSDILPETAVEGQGNGYVAAVGKKAAENGLSAVAARQEASDISWRHFLDAADGSPQDAAEKQANVQRLQDALAEIRAPVMTARKAGLLDKKIEPKQPEVKDIAKMLKAEKALREFEKKYKEAKAGIKEAGIPKGTVIMEGSDDDATTFSERAAQAIEEKYHLDDDSSPEDIKKALTEELTADLQQMSASKLLDATDAEIAQNRKSLKEHIGVGSYAALNTASLAVSKEPLSIDRVTADILGPEAAAQLLVKHWSDNLSADELEDVKEAVGNYHARTQREIADGAMAKYEQAKKDADSIELPEVTDAGGLMLAQIANDSKAKLLNDARKELGVALGRLQTTAAIVKALMEKPVDSLKVNMGAVGNKQAVAQARCLGLDVGSFAEQPNDDADYQIDSDGINKYMTVSKQGLEKMQTPADPEYSRKFTAALDIKRGKKDEAGWLPHGIEAHSASIFDSPAERMQMVSRPLALNESMSPDMVERSVEDYIGGQLADGQDPESIRQDLFSAEFQADQVPKAQEGAYIAACASLGFGTYDQTKALDSEALNARAQAIVDKRIEQSAGNDKTMVAINKQRLPSGEVLNTAIHATLSQMPQAKVCFKGTAQLEPQDKNAIRDFFWKNMTDDKMPTGADTRAEAKATAEAKEAKPKAYQVNIFGESEEVQDAPDTGGEGKTEHAWDRYVKAMGNTDRAYQTIQEMMRGELMTGIAEHLGKQTGTEFKSGTKRLEHWDRHVLGLVHPDKQAQILGDRALAEKKRLAQVASRSGGKFAKEDASGARRDRAEALLKASSAKQMMLFKAGKSPAAERLTLGDMAENQVKSVFKYIADNFDAKRPVEMPTNVDMSTDDRVMRQRAIKLLCENKRVGNNLGVGSGKTITALGGFSELHHQGKVKRAIMAVPSVVQGQFGSEALRFMTPGKYKWFANPAASPDERRASYSDKSKHMVIVTHQALREDLIHALAGHKFGGDMEKAGSWLENSTEDERKSAMKEAMESKGWDFDMSVVDEGHDLLNRQGKANSRMANAIDAMTFNTPYYMPMTADPIKNDVTEAFSMLHKIDPVRYNDGEKFKAKYGINTEASKEALQQEMMPYNYTGRIKSDAAPTIRETHTHDLHPEQQKMYGEVLRNYRTANKLQKKGDTSNPKFIEAVKAITPHTFRGIDESKHEAAAKRIGGFLASARDGALDRIVNSGHNDKDIGDAKCAKIDDLVNRIVAHKDEAGKQRPGVIFAHSIAAVNRINKELKAKGIRSTTQTGSHSSSEKEHRRLQFQPGAGEPEVDWLVCSDAGAVGQNLQRASTIANMDAPHTAKTYEQRIGRMDRVGQENPDCKVWDIVSNTPYEKTRRDRLADKNELREIFTSPTEMLDDTGMAHDIWQSQQARVQRQSGSAPEDLMAA